MKITLDNQNYVSYIDGALIDKRKQNGENGMESHDYIEPGTNIHVAPGYRGILVETIIKRDQFGNPISVFRVKLMQKYHFGDRKYKAIKPIIQNVNYTAVNCIDKQ
uniref:Uncharacterized protein n=1 Tax=viral metagenome TaxID=1070528 RepID=A0A6H2A013_9ZZZZ